MDLYNGNMAINYYKGVRDQITSKMSFIILSDLSWGISVLGACSSLGAAPNATFPSRNETVAPGNESAAGNETGIPGNESSTGNETVVPGNDSTSGNETVTPGNDSAAGNETVVPVPPNETFVPDG